MIVDKAAKDSCLLVSDVFLLTLGIGDETLPKLRIGIVADELRDLGREISGFIEGHLRTDCTPLAQSLQALVRAR